MNHTEAVKLSAVIKSKITIDQDTNCHVWQGSLRDGYARIKYRNEEGLHTKSVHRIVYEIEHGQIPEHAVVHHTCGVRKCVNVEHLQAVTQVENVAEMLERNSYIKKIAALEAELTNLKSLCVCQPNTLTIQ